MAWCLLVLSLAPWVTVVGYELRGHEHNARVLQSAPVEVRARGDRPGDAAELGAHRGSRSA